MMTKSKPARLKHEGSKPARFISFEGLDGSGKSTQITMLAEYLKKTYDVRPVITQEPYGEDFRQLLNKKGADFDGLTQIFLLAAARKHHIETIIRPALADGRFILCDRFSQSSFAYQGYGFGVDLDIIDKINQLACGGLDPDMIFLLDMDVELLKKRVSKRASGLSSYEALGDDFYHKVRRGFLALAKKEANHCHIIDASQAINDIHQKIRGYITMKDSAPSR